MKFAYYIKKRELSADERIRHLLDALIEGGAEVYDIATGLQDGSDMLLSFGGDGTFLAAARMAAPSGLPVLGVNMGRLGFLSDSKMEDGLCDALLKGAWCIEEREMLQADVPGCKEQIFILNEVSVGRAESSMLAIDVSVDCSPLPTYWADGLLVSTSSGSTAYSLSVGGPICTPDLKAFIIAPVAPHNLNVRPLVVPADKRISICPRTRHNSPVMFNADNRSMAVPSGTKIEVFLAPFCLKRVRLGKSNFIDALRSKLFWGEDARNNK